MWQNEIVISLKTMYDEAKGLFIESGGWRNSKQPSSCSAAAQKLELRSLSKVFYFGGILENPALIDKHAITESSVSPGPHKSAIRHIRSLERSKI